MEEENAKLRELVEELKLQVESKSQKSDELLHKQLEDLRAEN